MAESREAPESALTVKWWGVLVVILALIGWLSVSVITAQERITKLEITSAYIAASVVEIKAYVKDTNNEMKEFIKETRRR